MSRLLHVLTSVPLSHIIAELYSMLVPIANASSLSAFLPLATITVLLLTAPWSGDTSAARDAVRHAASLTTCPSIQYLELSLTASDLHARPKRSQTDTTPPEHPSEALIQSATTDPPYLPYLRVIQHASIRPHHDALDATTVATHLRAACAPNTSHIPAVSRDVLARAARLGRPAAIVVERRPPGHAWRVVQAALADRPHWVAAHAHAVKDAVFVTRNRVQPPAVVLVDRRRGAYETHSLRAVTSASHVLALLDRFETRIKPWNRVIASRMLRYLDSPSWRLRSHLDYPMNMVGSGNYGREMFSQPAKESVLWVIVSAPWCAYCQRAGPTFDEFVGVVRMAATDVDVVQVSDADDLPAFLDEMVEGLPTLLRIQERDGWISGVQEFIAALTIDGLLDMHHGHVEQKLRASFASLKERG